MAQIGTLGDIVFEVSTDKIHTFKDFNRSSSARLATHEIIGKKPIVEFLSPDLEQITFSMHLNTLLGVDIAQTLERLREIRDTGEIVNLVINNEPVTQNKWLVQSLSEPVKVFDGKGGIVSMDISVTLTEYVENILTGGGNANS